MNRTLFKLFSVFSILGFGAVANAQQGYTSSSKDFREPNTLRDQTFGLIPQVGVATFVNTLGETDSRQLMGLGMEYNFAALAQSAVKDSYMGLSTGVFYSHIGSPSSDFFGSNAVVTTTPGSNMLVIPANLKLGYNFTDAFRASVRGGGNVIYRSVAASASLGDNTGGFGPQWATYPNVGFDLEFQLGDSVAVIARPDLTIAPNDNMFMGTLGADIAL